MYSVVSFIELWAESGLQFLFFDVELYLSFCRFLKIPLQVQLNKKKKNFDNFHT